MTSDSSTSPVVPQSSHASADAVPEETGSVNKPSTGGAVGSEFPQINAPSTFNPPDAPYIVCLGASAGGLDALQSFVAAIPPDTGAAFVVIAHFSPNFKSLMPELLARHTQMPVTTASDQVIPAANTVYIIPPAHNMVFQDGRFLLEPQNRKPGHSVHLPIDLFLSSLAHHSPHRSVGVILSGKGSDGTRGAKSLKEAGGAILAQDPHTAQFDGMPRSAIESGVVDSVGTPSDLAHIAVEIIHSGKLPDGAAEEAGQDDSTDIAPVLQTVKDQLNVNLSHLRSPMLRRRIQRRIALLGMGDMGQYVERLQADAAEARAFVQDTLIGVTGFFRDPLAFMRLQKHLASEFSRRTSEEPFRVWVPACCSGEEVYSLAMLILETLEAVGRKPALTIFATDVDDDSISRAAKGQYSIAALPEIGPARAARFFTQSGDMLCIKPEIREMVVFAHHDLVKDPPFTRIDLVSCRNLLIYLAARSQESVLAWLHFSLRRGGTLFLGSAEALGLLEPEFEIIDARSKIYRKERNIILPTMRLRAGLRDPMLSASALLPGRGLRERETPQRQIVEVLTEHEGRTAALVTTDGTLIEVIGDPLNIFVFPKGRPTSDISRLVIEEVGFALASGLQRIRRGEPAVLYAVEFERLGRRHFNTRLIKLPPIANSGERVLMLVEPSQRQQLPMSSAPTDEVSSSHVKDLQRELMQTRESLQATIEELQTANEEQQSTNEELVAANEELQSTNEELQSVNEELSTVNVEYQKKNQELAVMAADLDNLLRNINVATLFLDSNLRVRKFTPAIEQVIKLMDQDVGRPVEHFAHNLVSDFMTLVRRVLETGEGVDRDARGVRGNWMLMRILPYYNHGGQRSGIVITFVDVTPLKNAHEMTRVANDQLAEANKQLGNQRQELEDLFSIVAHDLKRPVLALDGLLSLLGKMEKGGGQDAECSDLFSKARSECKRMRAMLTDLDGISGLQHREVVFELLDIQSWLDSVVEPFRARADAAGIRLNCTSDTGMLSIPRSILEECAINLIENAFKYGCSNPSPRVDVSCRVVQHTVDICVIDNGKGIDPENHSSVFEPFRRLDPDMAEGSGIGLLAVRRLMGKIGGDVRLESAVGKGAKFCVRCPTGPDMTVEPKVPTRKRVLLVEDDLLDAKQVERALGSGYFVVRAQEMADAESRLRADRFDIVLLDLSLPDGHGFELVQRMRAGLRLDTPIVVITGHGEGLSPSVMSAMIQGYVPKDNLSAESLISIVTNALNR